MNDLSTTPHTPTPARVTLVGAGPGDPKLLTVAAIEALRTADAVFYDALVNPIILSYCRQGIERIPVGKRCGRHSHEQDEINRLLVERALRGGHVVRLKGGDPFVFGRGGEELLALRQHAIPFTIVPGITAGNSVSTYSGIPVTHRGVSRSVTFITASTKEHKVEATSWRALVEVGGTLVFYMGSTVIPALSRLLIEAGLSPDTPACVTTDGTLPSQRRLIAPISAFTPDFADYTQLSPGLFIVGEVVRYADEFAFFAPTPLSQVKLLAVSVEAERSQLADIMADEVAYIHTLPTSKSTCDPQATMGDIEPGSWIIFSTTASVDYFVQQLVATGRDLRSIGLCHVAAIGRTTEKRLRSYGLCADFVPVDRDEQNLYAELSHHLGATPATLYIPHKRDAAPTRWIEQYLTSHGHIAHLLPLYCDTPVEYQPDDVLFLNDIGFTHIVFTSTKAVEQYLTLADAYSLRPILERGQVVALGDSVAQLLTDRGFSPALIIRAGGMAAVAEAIRHSLV